MAGETVAIPMPRQDEEEPGKFNNDNMQNWGPFSNANSDTFMSVFDFIMSNMNDDSAAAKNFGGYLASHLTMMEIRPENWDRKEKTNWDRQYMLRIRRNYGGRGPIAGNEKPLFRMYQHFKERFNDSYCTMPHFIAYLLVFYVKKNKGRFIFRDEQNMNEIYYEAVIDVGNESRPPLETLCVIMGKMSKGILKNLKKEAKVQFLNARSWPFPTQEAMPDFGKLKSYGLDHNGTLTMSIADWHAFILQECHQHADGQEPDPWGWIGNGDYQNMWNGIWAGKVFNSWPEVVVQGDYQTCLASRGTAPFTIKFCPDFVWRWNFSKDSKASLAQPGCNATFIRVNEDEFKLEVEIPRPVRPYDGHDDDMGTNEMDEEETTTQSDPNVDERMNMERQGPRCVVCDCQHMGRLCGRDQQWKRRQAVRPICQRTTSMGDSNVAIWPWV